MYIRVAPLCALFNDMKLLIKKKKSYICSIFVFCQIGDSLWDGGSINQRPAPPQAGAIFCPAFIQ